MSTLYTHPDSENAHISATIALLIRGNFDFLSVLPVTLEPELLVGDNAAQILQQK
jgi:hypothetical protein